MVFYLVLCKRKFTVHLIHFGISTVLLRNARVLIKGNGILDRPRYFMPFAIPYCVPVTNIRRDKKKSYLLTHMDVR